jgi:hypothetical protein
VWQKQEKSQPLRMTVLWGGLKNTPVGCAKAKIDPKNHNILGRQKGAVGFDGDWL